VTLSTGPAVTGRGHPLPADAETAALAEAARADYRDLIAAYPEMFGNQPGAAFEILLDDADIRSAEKQMARRLAAKDAPEDWARVGVV
jgi:ADP-ribose pyrophosphatase